jgi:hypothetical protein
VDFFFFAPGFYWDKLFSYTDRNNYRLLVALQNCFPQKWPILLLKATHGMQFKEI